MILFIRICSNSIRLLVHVKKDLKTIQYLQICSIFSPSSPQDESINKQLDRFDACLDVVKLRYLDHNHQMAFTMTQWLRLVSACLSVF